MRIYTDEKEKLLAAWLTPEEHDNQDIMTPLRQICAQFKAMHYQPIIYCSGNGILQEDMAALLCHVRHKMEKLS